MSEDMLRRVANCECCVAGNVRLLLCATNGHVNVNDSQLEQSVNNCQKLCLLKGQLAMRRIARIDDVRT